MSTYIAIAFGKIVKKWRRARGLSQTELAQKCSLDRTFISLLETGKKQPSLSTIFSLSKALKVEPQELVSQTARQSKRLGSRQTMVSASRRL